MVDEKVIVLTTKGKGEGAPEYAVVNVFETKSLAAMYCNLTNKSDEKYWTKCEIVNNDEIIDLYHNPYEERDNG